MQLVQGETLEKRWDGLLVSEKEEVCLQLKKIVECLGQFQLPTDSHFIGNSLMHFQEVDWFSKLE